MSWVTQILPYIEQGNAYRKIDFTKSVYAPENAAVRAYRISTLICSSDPGSYSAISVALASYRGVHHDAEAPIDVNQNGVLHLNSAVKYEDIPDGSSSTIFLGEGILNLNSSQGWMSGTRATLRNMGTRLNASRTPGGYVPTPTDDKDAGLVGGFSSYHTGGGHFAMGDGSVRFLSENIEPELYQHLANRHDGELTGDF
jgi:prepilin-type processing-associated H-X9-DG protein